MTNIHIIPIGGEEPDHFVGLGCWCHPMRDREDPNLITHNAKDLRDVRERFNQPKPHPTCMWEVIKSN